MLGHYQKTVTDTVPIYASDQYRTVDLFLQPLNVLVPTFLLQNVDFSQNFFLKRLGIFLGSLVKGGYRCPKNTDCK